MLVQIIVVLIVLCIVFGLVQQLLPANPFKTPALILIALLGCLLLLSMVFPVHSGHALFW